MEYLGLLALLSISVLLSWPTADPPELSVAAASTAATSQRPAQTTADADPSGVEELRPIPDWPDTTSATTPDVDFVATTPYWPQDLFGVTLALLIVWWNTGRLTESNQAQPSTDPVAAMLATIDSIIQNWQQGEISSQVCLDQLWHHLGKYCQTRYGSNFDYHSAPELACQISPFLATTGEREQLQLLLQLGDTARFAPGSPAPNQIDPFIGAIRQWLATQSHKPIQE